MNLPEAKEIVAQKDGYNSYDQIRESLQEEYTSRAYNLLMSRLYSEEEVSDLILEASDITLTWAMAKFNKEKVDIPDLKEWFNRRKKK